MTQKDTKTKSQPQKKVGERQVEYVQPKESLFNPKDATPKRSGNR